MTQKHYRSGWVSAIGVILLTTYPTTTIAQITGDGTLGTQVNGALTAPCTGNCIINGGTIRDVNLFHSFKEFSIPTSGQAWFNNAPQIQNILTRITGNSISSIDGLIKTNGSANLFFLNPNGILFGPNARLQIGGSFFASTANSFKFADGSEFSAVNPKAPPLLAINVPIGLQPGTIVSNRAIVNQGNLTAGKDLTLNADQLELQGQLIAGRDLTLQAQDTVKIRDSATLPLVVQSGRDLTIQGNQKVDILALNHPKTSIHSDRNLSLISDGIISGDAHFSSGGEVHIRSLSGQLATFTSLYDPIISSTGNVTIAAAYTGASLLIESQGSVRIQGAVTINAPDMVSNFVGSDTLLRTQPGLIIRSGQSNLLYGGSNQNNPLAFTPGNIPSGITLDQPVRVEPNAEGGIVRLSAAQGGISVARIQTGRNSTSERSGSIELTALQDIITGVLITSPGGGGDITLTSIQGSIKSLGGISAGSSPRAGDIKFFAFGDITTGPLMAESLLGIRGGNITLVSRFGSINTIDESDEIGLQTFAFWGPQGGNITLLAYGNITTQDLLANGRVNAGNIQLISQTGTINTQKGFLQAALGNGGTITLSAFRDILTSQISAGSVIGNGGAISLSSASGTIQVGSIASSSVIGNGGAISLSARNGSIVGKSTVLNTFAVSESNGLTGNGGKVILEAQDVVSGLEVNTVASGGISGAVEVYGFGDLSLSNNRILTAQQVKIQPCLGCDLITVNLNDRGQSGNVSVNSIANLTFNDHLIQGDTRSRNLAGNVAIISPGLITFNNSQIISNTSSTGQAGSIGITAGDGINLTNGSQLSARTSNVGTAGNININTQKLTLTNGVNLSTSTSGTGQAGEINVIANTVNLNQGAQISTNTSSNGKAGNLSFQIQDALTLSGIGTGLFATTTPGSIGKGGSIFIDPRTVTIQDGAKIAVDSQGSGIGGNIVLQAGRLELRDRGSITATTASAKGGDIDLTVNDLMVLRRGSQISTNAGTAEAGGNGGNIRINAPFVVGVLSENSDITANAFTGNGGKVEITTQGIYGLQFQPQLTPFSDITASSKFGLNGTVTINSLNVDPSRGLASLPINLNDPSQRISQGCNPGSKSTTGKFIATGRGGIPHNPDEPLESRSVMTKWIALPKDTETAQNLEIPNPNRTIATSTTEIRAPIVEAQHWIRQADGTVELVANLPSAYPASLLNSSLTCRSDSPKS